MVVEDEVALVVVVVAAMLDATKVPSPVHRLIIATLPLLRLMKTELLNIMRLRRQQTPRNRPRIAVVRAAVDSDRAAMGD